MKRILLTAIGGMALLGGPALGADLPSRKEPPLAPVVYAPVFTWTGFYVGLNAGGAWRSGNNNNNGLIPFGFVNSNGTLPTYVNFAALNAFNNNNGSKSAFTGGIQAGYNYQIGAFVIGVETDINYAGGGNHNNNNNGFGFATTPFFFGDPAGPLAPPAGVVGGAHDPFSGYYQLGAGNNGNNNNYFGTVRARLGYAVDRALFYVTGGLAYGGTKNRSGGFVTYWAQPQVVGGPIGAPTFTYGLSNGFNNNNGNNNNVGWTVGGGVEYAFTYNWTVKLEYLYANFGKNNNNNLLFAPAFYTLPGGGVVNLAGTGVRYFSNGGRNNNNVNILRVGVNYKF